jgi:hypothetical protein
VPLNFIAKATQSEEKITLKHHKDTASYLVDHRAGVQDTN